MVRISSPAPTSSASVNAVCVMVTPRRSRRSPSPAVPLGPAFFSTSMGSNRKPRSAGKAPAKTAASTAATNPQASTAHPAVTLSNRGIACPAINLNSFTIPNASPTPNAPPSSASNRLSVETCRKRAMRPMPIALRTAYSCCRCKPRTSRSAAALPQPINRTRAAAPRSGNRILRPSKFSSLVSDLSCGVIPSKLCSACASLAASTVSSPCASSSRAPSRNRATIFQSGSFTYFGSGATGIQKSTNALTS